MQAPSFGNEVEQQVPRPAHSRVVETLRPVSSGTSTVAPNMANMCCTPRMNMRLRPAGARRKCLWSNRSFTHEVFLPPTELAAPKKRHRRQQNGNAPEIWEQ